MCDEHDKDSVDHHAPDCGFGRFNSPLLQVEGFPPSTELKTVYVEHDIDSEDADIPSQDYVANDPTLSGTPREDIINMLISVGFTDEYRAKVSGPL